MFSEEDAGSLYGCQLPWGNVHHEVGGWISRGGGSHRFQVERNSQKSNLCVPRSRVR